MSLHHESPSTYRTVDTYLLWQSSISYTGAFINQKLVINRNRNCAATWNQTNHIPARNPQNVSVCEDNTLYPTVKC